MKKSFLVAFVLMALIPASPAISAPITFNTALPVAKGEGLARIQAKYIRSTDDPSDLNRKLTVWTTPLVGAYGLTSRLAVFGIVPFVYKKLELDTTKGRKTRRASGLGDATFLARYTLWKKDMSRQTLRIAPFGGLKVPTGEHDKDDSLGKLPRTLQPGSGSWDGIAGCILTWQTLSHQLDASVLYKLNREADDYEFGDVARMDISYQHRVWPKQLSMGVPTFYYGVIESNLIWKGKDRVAGHLDDNTGGTLWYLTPGLQRVTRRAVIECALQIPVVQNLNGKALENDFVFIFSVRVNF